MDITTAYLHADVDTEIYMLQPEGFEKQGENGEVLVCKLQKSLYGLKQAGRNWNKLLTSWLRSQNMHVGSSDPCLYVHQGKHNNKDFLAIVIYVDDLFTVYNNPKLRDELVQNMSKVFKLVDLGYAKWILGMRINISKNSIKIDQEKYTLDTLEKFNMQNCSTLSTPAIPEATGHQISKPTSREEYRSLVGSLIYLSVITRPDIAFAVGRAGQFMENPTEANMIAAKRILRYLQSDKKLGLTYSTTGSPTLEAYADADWGGCHTTRRSTTGYIFTLGGAAISWSSKRQQTVALSTAEAEYMAASSATQELIFLRALLRDFGHTQKEPTVLHQDNQGVIALANDFILNQRTKHIDIKYHFIREKVESGVLTVDYTSTQEMIADCMTKAVSKQILDKAKEKIFGESDKTFSPTS